MPTAAMMSGMTSWLLHDDDALLIAAKPAGLLSVPGRGEEKQDCLAAWVQAEFPDAQIVHRLDMATSGLMVFARGKTAQRQLGDAFAGRTVSKRYIAVVAGRPAADAGEIDLPLAADWPRRPRQRVDVTAGKPSLTRYRLLFHDEAGNTSRLELEPVTGRSHQLRVHLMAIGHPIVGDALYAPEAVQALAPRLLLHAQRLTLPHPSDGHLVSFEHAAPF